MAPALQMAGHDGIEIAYQRLGYDGEPLLLIAGLAADLLSWNDGFCAALVDAGFQVVRFDHRDTGESTRLSAAYGLRDMALDAFAVLDAVQWSSAHVVGHSMGGAIGQIMAIEQPGRVRSLVSISATSWSPIGRIRRRTLLRMMLANPSTVVRPRPRSGAEAGERLVRGHRVIGSPGYRIDEDWLRRIGELSYARGGFDPDVHARHLAAIHACPDLRPALAAVRVPALVLHGAADPVVRPEAARATAAAIDDAELVIIAGMGHDLPEELWPAMVGHIRATADKASPTR